ncbi:MAG TPA: DUF3225 domain-containing protein [Bacteroidales bacterium]|jgi:ketosteroid isomerase-like protein|nr:nuclear transport factor 2 family protein [Bacteroidales bacterium]MCZ2282701.1 nuclear transport factor 2 family protein [Bacteroidales bacterium]HPX33989.1 DUF3225 domain-containing protein [Bacteroidales bacterium]HQB47992.1 DUF3225 domain-containing protein [Bacteroidales bacterium]
MKKFTLLSSLLFVFLLTACNTIKISDKEKEKALVKNVLDKYRTANENQDINLIEEIWSPDETIISFGTERGERLVGFSQIKEVVQRQFDTFSETFITPANQVIEISDDGKTAWFSQMMNYNFILNGEPYSFRNLRYTGVLVKNEGKWKLVQTHMSVAYNPLEK